MKLKRFLGAALLMGGLFSYGGVSNSNMAIAQDGPPPRPYGAAFRALTGNTLEAYQITMLGWAKGTIATNFDKGDIGRTQSFFDYEEPFNFNQAALMLCQGTGCLPAMIYKPTQNILSRITPLPGPPPSKFAFGWNVTGMWGRDVTYLKTKGVDDFGKDVNRDHKFGLTQWYVDMYIPIFDGMTLMAGSWQTTIGNEIGYPFNPPNWFNSHTHILAHGPAKHVGALATIKVPTSKSFGLLSVEGGVVKGWNNLETEMTGFAPAQENDDLHYIFGIRYRTPDMKTWVDLEGIYGNGANDFSDLQNNAPKGGGSPYLAYSSDGRKLDRFHATLSVVHHATKELTLALEGAYGHQEGGDAPGFITEDASWYGLNVAARYKLKSNLHAHFRAEWFKDEKGANVLWIIDPDTDAPNPPQAAKGSVYAFTANLQWDLMPNLTVTPELRYDYFDGTGKMFAGGDDDQLLGTVSVLLKF